MPAAWWLAEYRRHPGWAAAGAAVVAVAVLMFAGAWAVRHSTPAQVVQVHTTITQSRPRPVPGVTVTVTGAAPRSGVAAGPRGPRPSGTGRSRRRSTAPPSRPPSRPAPSPPGTGTPTGTPAGS